MTEKGGAPSITYMYNGFPSQATSAIMAGYLKQQYTMVTIAKNNVSPEIAQQLQTEIKVKQEAIKIVHLLSELPISLHLLYICLL